MHACGVFCKEQHCLKLQFVLVCGPLIGCIFDLQVYIEGLCHGNLLEEEVIQISNIFKKNFPEQPLPVEMRHGDQILCFPSQSNLVRDVNVKNKPETNSVVEVGGRCLCFMLNPLFLAFPCSAAVASFV